MAPRARCAPAWLAGTLLLASFLPALQLEMTQIPNITPYPALQPTDTGYPGNIPADLPTTLEAAPPILSQGPQTSCPTTVRQVLLANGRNVLAQILPEDVLSGRMSATILAPPDAFFQQVAASGVNGLTANSQGVLAAYHVLQGKLSMSDLASTSGLYYNSTMAKPPCPTACQVVTTQTSPVDLNGAGPVTFVRSATQTARITQGDLQACNSVVHLIDRALQPCCTSMYEFLGNFSIVKIQPSFFDGYAPLPAVQNTDDFNRRLFEEAAVDFMLYASPANMSKIILWPSTTAWSSVNLAQLLPGITLDVATRTNAMRILALYAMSYSNSLLPKDIPAADGSAPSIQFPFNTALKNVTDNLWTCSDTLTVNTPALPATGVPTATQNPATITQRSPSPSPLLNPGQQVLTPSPSPPVSPSPSPSLTPVPGQIQVLNQNPGVVQNQNPNVVQNQNVNVVQNPALVQAGKKRSLLAAASGATKTVNMQTVYETCENTRILIVDAVAVPCDFVGLVKNYASFENKLAAVYKPTEYKTLAAAYYDWLVSKGLIKEGTPVSSYKSAAGGSANGGAQRQVMLATSVFLGSMFLLMQMM